MTDQTDAPQTKTVVPESKRMVRTGMLFLPDSFDQLIKYSEYIAKSDMVPKDYRDKPHNVAIAVQWGMELGMSPLQAIQNIAVINGRPTLWGDLVVAIVQSHPDFLDMIDEEMKDNQGNVIGYRVTLKRAKRTPIVRTYTKQDAEVAGLWGKRGQQGQPTPWVTNPKRMLLVRARAFAMRDQFSDALRGIRVREEEEDNIIDLGPSDYRTVDQNTDKPAGSNGTGGAKGPIVMPTEKTQATEPSETQTGAQETVNDDTTGGDQQQGQAQEEPKDQDAPQEQAQPEEIPEEEQGLHGLTESMRNTLARRAEAAGLDIAGVLKKYPRVDAKNINDVLTWLLKLSQQQTR